MIELHNLQNFDQQLTHTKNQYQQAKDSIKNLKKRHEKKLQKKSVKKTQQEAVINVPELSKKEKAALLAAEQRAEQSKRDKERQAMVLKEQHDLTATKASQAAPALTEVKKSLKQSSVKSKNKNKLNKPIIDEDLEYLDSIIAHMQRVQTAPTLIVVKKIENYVEDIYQELNNVISQHEAKDLERKKRIEQSNKLLETL